MTLDTPTPPNEQHEPVCTVLDITSRDEEKGELMMLIPLDSNDQIADDDAVTTRDSTCSGSISWASGRCMKGAICSSLIFRKKQDVIRTHLTAKGADIVLSAL